MEAVDLLPLLLDAWAAAYPGYRAPLSELFPNASALTGREMLCNVITGNVTFLDIFLPQAQRLISPGSSAQRVESRVNVK